MINISDILETVVLDSDNTLYVDVDDTLIIWNGSETDELFKNKNYKKLKIKDPYLQDCYNIVIPHIRNINTLKRNFGMGRKIIVWSMGGDQWAKVVVKALELEDFVTLVMGKPKIYMDDKDMYDWGCTRCYLPIAPESEYKKL